MGLKEILTGAVGVMMVGQVAIAQEAPTDNANEATLDPLCVAYNTAIDNMDQEGLNKALDNIMDRVSQLREAGDKDAWFHDVCPEGTTGAGRKQASASLNL